MITIRPATIEDLPAITDIYNEAILHTTATFDTETKTLEQRAEWFRQHDQNHPIIVAASQDEIAGWASLSRWSDRSAYDGTAELSVYVHVDYRGKGIGKKLTEVIVEEGVKAGLHTILSRITTENVSSIHIHELMGFHNVGVMREVGYKFDKYLDVHIMQKML